MLRKAISNMARSQKVKLPATIEDPSVFGDIKIALQKFGYANDAPDPELWFFSLYLLGIHIISVYFVWLYGCFILIYNIKYRPE